MTSKDINTLTDYMIVQSLLHDPVLLKNAGFADVGSMLVDKVKQYVGNHVDSENKTSSILNLIAPAGISKLFSFMGMPMIGILLGLATSVFHIDFGGILTSIYDSIKNLISGGKSVSSSDVDSVVGQAVEAHSKPSTPAQDAAAEKYLAEHKAATKTPQSMRMVKLAMAEFSSFQKVSSPLYTYAAKSVPSALSNILGWVFKLVLGAAGFMVAGDVINKLLGRDNALDNTLQNGKPTHDTPSVAPKVISKQTKFKIQPSYKNAPRPADWELNIPNNANSISSMLIGFAKKVYQGLDGLESQISSTPGFQVIRDDIVNYNRSSEGDNMVVIPKRYFSEKDIVDHFIDDVAESVA